MAVKPSPRIDAGRRDAVSPATHRCRSCDAPLERLFVDLGMAPPCEAFLTEEQLFEPEQTYPQDVRICDACLLVQMPAYIVAEENFSEYAYYASFSDTWVAHAERFVEAAIARAGLGPESRVVEVASNDGYLLQYVVAQGIPALGIEPAGNIVEVARRKGVATRHDYFSSKVAADVRSSFGAADLIVANNVFAHVPSLNDFTAGLAILLKPGGLLSIEVAYLPKLIERNEFDTIYHEHFMYYTLRSAQVVLHRHGLRVLDVEELPTHGGSIRLWVVHDDDARPSMPSVDAQLDLERAAGLDRATGYAGFPDQVEATKRDLLEFLIDERRRGSTVAGYGAPGKANTLLNYCGIRTDLVSFLVDRNPYKQGRYTPGTHIPIFAEEHLADVRPEVIVIMPWNLRDEIVGQLAYTAEWGARLVVAIPRLEIVSPT
jgi:SAM-dependent methyltransferase